MASGLQIEMPLAVAVCAWCQPVKQGLGLGTLSHGICPRHFRQLERELKGIVLKRRSRRPAVSLPAEVLLPL